MRSLRSVVIRRQTWETPSCHLKMFKASREVFKCKVADEHCQCEGTETDFVHIFRFSLFGDTQLEANLPTDWIEHREQASWRRKLARKLGRSPSDHPFETSVMM